MAPLAAYAGSWGTGSPSPNIDQEGMTLSLAYQPAYALLWRVSRRGTTGSMWSTLRSVIT